MNPRDPYSSYQYLPTQHDDVTSFTVHQRGGLRTAVSVPTEALARLYAMAPDILSAFESLVSSAYMWFDANWDVSASEETLQEIVEDDTDEWEDAHPSITASAMELLYVQSLLDELGHHSRDYEVSDLQMELPF